MGNFTRSGRDERTICLAYGRRNSPNRDQMEKIRLTGPLGQGVSGIKVVSAEPPKKNLSQVQRGKSSKGKEALGRNSAQCTRALHHGNSCRLDLEGEN